MRDKPISENIQDVGQYAHGVRLGDIKKEYREECIDMYEITLEEGDDEETREANDNIIIDGGVSIDNIENFDRDLEYDFDEWEYNDFVKGILNPKNKYAGFLLFFGGSTWDGRDGYRIEKKAEKVLSFDYDVHIDYAKRSPDSKVNCFTVYSHDVPMGATLTVVGVTRAELNKAEDLSDYEGFEAAVAFIKSFEPTEWVVNFNNEEE